MVGWFGAVWGLERCFWWGVWGLGVRGWGLSRVVRGFGAWRGQGFGWGWVWGLFRWCGCVGGLLR